MSERDETRKRFGVLEEHAAECADCEAAELPMERINAALSAGPDGPAPGPDRLDTARMSAALLDRSKVLLAARREEAYRRNVSAGLAVALAPLPFVLVYAGRVLESLYGLLAGALPDVLASYLVGGYAAAAALTFGLTYAAIPLLIDRAPAVRSAS